MEVATNSQVFKPALSPAVKLKYCLYARKSTESEERQILSIDSQVKEMLQIAEREDLEIVDIRRESHSAKDSGERPVFKEILADIRRGRFNGILAWDASRISRNAGDLGSVVDLMDQKSLIEIRTFSQTFVNSPNEKFLLMILCSQAKLENDNRVINVKRGLRTRCEMGLRPGVAPTGYLNSKRTDEKCQANIDTERAPVIKKMFEKVAYEKWSGKKLYMWLKFELNFRTANGKKHLSLGNIFRILYNPFYYGMFEYPKNSGNWYQGKHEPIISKELFDQTIAQLKSNVMRTENQEFTFTKLMACGLCGSGVSASEKWKKQNNGNVHRYVYYGCTKAKDKHCKCGYIEEKELINQFVGLMDKVSFDDNSIKHKIKSEVERIKKFNNIMLGIKEKIEVKDLDIKNYAKYILKEGTDIEKRELLSCLKTSIFLDNKSISIKPQ